MKEPSTWHTSTPQAMLSAAFPKAKAAASGASEAATGSQQQTPPHSLIYTLTSKQYDFTAEQGP